MSTRRIQFMASALAMLVLLGTGRPATGQPPPPLCCEDYTGPDVLPDGKVGIDDFLGILASWGAAPGSKPNADIRPGGNDGCPQGGDGLIGVEDFLGLLAAWGPCDLPIDRCADVLDPANTYGRISADGSYPFRLNGVLDGPPRPTFEPNGDTCFFPVGEQCCGFMRFDSENLMGDGVGINAESGFVGGDIWFHYTAPRNGTVFVSAVSDCLDSPLQFPYLELFASLECPVSYFDRVSPCASRMSDPMCGSRATIDQFTLKQGESVLIRIAGAFGQRGDGRLEVQSVDNSMCANAIDITGGFRESSDTTVGTQLAVVPTCDGITPQLPGMWFKITGNGREIDLQTDFGGLDPRADLLLSVYASDDGSCDTLTCVGAANDNIGSPSTVRERVEWCSEPGRVYYILVHGNPDAIAPRVPEGKFKITWSTPLCPGP